MQIFFFCLHSIIINRSFFEGFLLSTPIPSHKVFHVFFLINLIEKIIHVNLQVKFALSRANFEIFPNHILKTIFPDKKLQKFQIFIQKRHTKWRTVNFETFLICGRCPLRTRVKTFRANRSLALFILKTRFKFTGLIVAPRCVFLFGFRGPCPDISSSLTSFETDWVAIHFESGRTPGHKGLMRILTMPLFRSNTAKHALNFRWADLVPGTSLRRIIWELTTVTSIKWWNGQNTTSCS